MNFRALIEGMRSLRDEVKAMAYHEEMLARMRWAARRFLQNGQTGDYHKANRYIRGLIHAGTPTRAGDHNMNILIARANKLPARKPRQRK